MYNKIFSKILDSSVWLEPTPTRIVWITLLAAMDEEGFCSFAAIGNVAGRARVTLEEAKTALEILASPDPESSDPDNEGRRIERVSGGWVVLNATKYRDIVSRANAQEKTRERVKKFREKKKLCNVDVTPCNESVLPSEAVSQTDIEEKTLTLAVDNKNDSILPEWIPLDQWNGWVENRKKNKKSPVVGQSKTIAINKLKNWYEQGYDLSVILNAATFGNWQGLYLPKGDDGQVIKPRKSKYRQGNPNNPADWLAAQVPNTEEYL
jgi:hypothetical protein